MTTMGATDIPSPGGPVRVYAAVARRIDAAAEALSAVMAYVPLERFGLDMQVSRALEGIRALQSSCSLVPSTDLATSSAASSAGRPRPAAGTLATPASQTSTPHPAAKQPPVEYSEDASLYERACALAKEKASVSYVQRKLGQISYQATAALLTRMVSEGVISDFSGARAQPSGNGADFPAGAIHNGRTHVARLEMHHDFRSEAESLLACTDWVGLKACFEHLANHALEREAGRAAGDDAADRTLPSSSQ